MLTRAPSELIRDCSTVMSVTEGGSKKRDIYQTGKQVIAQVVEGWLFNIHQQACESTATEMDQ